MSFRLSAKQTIENQINALNALSRSLNEEFDDACALINNCTGKVVVTGMGKSGHIGNKIAATLASTGTPAFFMHPGEANHGDLGMLDSKDALIAISNSGETSELIHLLPSIKRLKIPVIAITNNINSSLAKFANVALNLHVKSEACSLGLAPTTSTTATLVLGDAIAIALLESKGFTAQDFAFSHPGGTLGKRLLLTVQDLMLKESLVPISQHTDVLSDALLEISSKGLGLTTVVKNNKMIGVFTDGDLRRALDKGINVRHALIGDVMTSLGVSIDADSLAVEALNLMQERKVNALIVTNEDRHPIGALNMHMLLQAGVV
ncbi:KpsF/GutQ family sugar-phosphate isomerase [Agaribacter marinus]|uniref:Arabinose 5-phosphate isomerase n=1 Tax=Agaribacter marinus TaxID=1431249 RepID=A0AA37T4B0_9ALTE|nr:KpsF/GutQ family sugar-phosphate isomerase [Agaribacter marinus]GLR72849.1 arabinose 5-phosphate isomerase [Agaribacter marinus]